MAITCLRYPTLGGVKSAITGDTDLIERLNSEITEEREKATEEAIAFVIEIHNQ